jgi:two-component system sensor histidine kinase RegB
MDLQTLAPSSGNERILRLLFWLRWMGVAALLAVSAVVHFVLDVRLPLVPLWAVAGALVAWNAWVYLARWQRTRVSDPELLANLGVDILALTAVLYFTGGSTNPFVSLYLVTIAIAASVLPLRSSWTIAAACALAYSVLLKAHVDLPQPHVHPGDFFDMHVTGMWVNFLLSAVVIASFVAAMARAIRERDRQLAAVRERALRDQQVLSLGALAASTAHELATPLSTVSMLLDEVSEDSLPDENARRRHALLRQQVGLMRERIEGLLDRVSQDEAASASRSSVGRFVSHLVEQFQALRPEVRLELDLDPAVDGVEIDADPAVTQALINLLDNAADASLEQGSHRVRVGVARSSHQVRISILDEGPGLDDSARRRAGTRPFTTKRDGHGLGLVLAHTAIELAGGRVALLSHAGRGLETRIELPAS